MILFHTLPPLLYEVLNCAIASTCFVALVIVVRYIATAYFHFRHEGLLPRPLSRWESFRALRTLKLAIGFLIFLSGEVPRMSWVWLARFLANTDRPSTWMGETPWVFVPVVASTLSVLGMACIVRALAPEAWGRFGYWMSLGTAAVTVIGTQIFR